MADQPRKPKRTVRAFSLALVASLALMAAVASTAGATSLTLLGVGGETGVSVSEGTGAVMQTDEKTFGCEKETTGEGSYLHESAAYLTLEFHGCSFLAAQECESPGAGTGTMVTSPLAMDFTKSAEGEKPIVVLSPFNTDVFAECGSTTLKGSLIGEITAPEEHYASEELTLEFDAVNDEQVYTETHRGREAQLVWSAFEGISEDMSLDASIDLELEQEFELVSSEDGHLDLDGGISDFTATAFGFTLRGETNEGNDFDVSCAISEETGTGSGAFEDSVSGEIELNYHNCSAYEGAVNCTTPGEETGTIKTDSLPMRLVYLSDGKPGLAIEENESSGKIMQFKCTFLAAVTVSGGVLGEIVYPEDYGYAPALGVAISAVEEGEGYVQKYTQTESEEEIGLQLSLNGGSANPASLETPTYITPGEGVDFVQLRE